MGPLDVSFLGRLLDVFAAAQAGHARGLFHDGKAHAGPVAVLFRTCPPGVLGFLAGLERTLTWAEPSTSLWKFIEPNSPPITQKLLPFVMISLLRYSAA